MADEVLTIKEVAALLKLAEKTVYAMAQAGEIPAFKIRGPWRIKRTELDQWIDVQGTDALVHRPCMGPLTAVVRYEELDYNAGPYSYDQRRITGGARLRLSSSLTGHVNVIHQRGLPGGDMAVDVALTYSLRH